MKLLVFVLILSFEAYAFEQANVFRVTSKSYESPSKVVELSPTFLNQEIGSNHRKWNMKSKQYQALVNEWLALPGSVDQLKKCPRNYIRFEFRNEKMKRTEFVCNEKSSSTRRRYLNFAEKLF